MKKIFPLFLLLLTLLAGCGQNAHTSYIALKFAGSEKADLIIATAEYDGKSSDNVVKVDLMLFQLIDDYISKLDTLGPVEEKKNKEGLSIERFIKGMSREYFLDGKAYSIEYLGKFKDELAKRSRDSKSVVKALEEVLVRADNNSLTQVQ